MLDHRATKLKDEWVKLATKRSRKGGNEYDDKEILSALVGFAATVLHVCAIVKGASLAILERQVMQPIHETVSDPSRVEPSYFVAFESEALVNNTIR